MTFDVRHVDLQIMITVFLDNFAGEISRGCCWFFRRWSPENLQARDFPSELRRLWKSLVALGRVSSFDDMSLKSLLHQRGKRKHLAILSCTSSIPYPTLQALQMQLNPSFRTSQNNLPATLSTNPCPPPPFLQFVINESPLNRYLWTSHGLKARGGGVLDISLGGEVQLGPSYPDPV